MKTIMLIFIFISNAFACLCTINISTSFTTTSTTIASFLEAQNRSLDLLKKSIEKSSDTIKDQNDYLDKEINLLKDETLMDEKLLFYLKQKNELK